MASVKFSDVINDVAFAYGSNALGFNYLAQPNSEEHQGQHHNALAKPLIIPSCTAQLAEAAMGQMDLAAIDEVMG